MLNIIKFAAKMALQNPKVKEGIKNAEVDSACREVLKQAGMEEAFTHGTGHGVGLDIHESPAINGRSKEKLIPGMVVTIEPGIYFTDTCGVRWEDLYEITETGARRLTLSAKSP